MMEQNDMETTKAREKFEQERMNRRAALRKLGMTGGMTLFGVLAFDDVARKVLDVMKQNTVTQQIADTLTKEFGEMGVAHADDSDPCDACYQRALNNFEACKSTALKNGHKPGDIAFIGCEHNYDVAMALCC